jgi:hypothetical protein
LSAYVLGDDTMDNLQVQINAVPVTGLDAIDVTTSTVGHNATAANDVEVGDSVSIVTSGVDGGASLLHIQLNIKFM